MALCTWVKMGEETSCCVVQWMRMYTALLPNFCTVSWPSAKNRSNVIVTEREQLLPGWCTLVIPSRDGIAHAWQGMRDT
jgi:hypothetical protein